MHLGAAGVAFALVLGGVLRSRDVPAQPAGAAASACDVHDVTYSVTGNLQLTQTPMDAGNGTYAVGPGKLVLRVDGRTGQVKLLSYTIPEHFGIEAKKVFWTTHVDTNANAAAQPRDACGHVAEGTLQGRTLTWTTKVGGLRTDGTLTCRGSLCGKFGAPPPGSSPLHIGPNDVAFQPFQFGADGRTFSMASTFVATTQAPKQTAHLSFSGREVRRVCAPVNSCQ
jgi:hypothetical protein